ncbi:MAG: hypothetical protein IPL48_10990 [Bacteroidetes bacterium]|nr:hypothetical protein [Bacteroidota bacterium]
MLTPGRNWSAGSEYRFGFNGKEKVDEISGSGKHFDFGERGYDPRIGQWWSIDPKFALQPGWSSYKFGLNNPIIFIDPEGETEFYFNGKWIGTDGVDNNLVAKVTDLKVKRAIIKSTKQGLNNETQSINKAAEFKNGMLLLNKDVLSYSNKMLKLSLTEKGQVGEFGNTMAKDGDNYTPTGEISYDEGGSTTIPLRGDVSLHSHPTRMFKTDAGIDYYSSASEPSMDEPGRPQDESAFKNFETNIIVGKNGDVVKRKDPNTQRTYFDESGRYSAIIVFDKNTNKVGTIGGGEADKMIEGDRGSLGKKFDKKQSP